MNLAMRKVVRKYKGCTDCILHKKAHSYVFFRGSSPCQVLFIGEAPGPDEDMVGQPFIGRSGELLDRWIEDSLEHTKFMILSGQADEDLRIKEGSIYSYGITNLVCCKPIDKEGKIRAPSKEEADACNPRLVATIKACNPKLLVFLGRESAKNAVLPEPLASLPRVELQHPAYILRQGGVGTLSYDQNLLKLVEGLETYLYGEEETESSSNSSQAPRSKKAGRKVVRKKTASKEGVSVKGKKAKRFKRSR